MLHDVGMKQKWLLDRLQRFIDDGDVLVFANQKVGWSGAGIGVSFGSTASMVTPCLCCLPPGESLV